MGDLFGMFNNDNKNREVKDDIVNNGKILLREEELDIAKNKIQTGEVNIQKEIIEEHKAVDVPVTHEEVIIERRAINEPSDEPVGLEETIHIPVSEEKVEVGKHTIITGEISAHKREVEETLKREEARVDSSGDPNIVSDDFDSFH